MDGRSGRTRTKWTVIADLEPAAMVTQDTQGVASGLRNTGLSGPNRAPPFVLAALHRAAGNLARDKRVPQHFLILQQKPQPGIVPPEMVNPDRGVNQDHLLLGADRRRRPALAFGSEPPIKASLRAASRETSASRPMRTSVSFSGMPVRNAALSRRVSSMLRVVFMSTMMSHFMRQVKRRPEPNQQRPVTLPP